MVGAVEQTGLGHHHGHGLVSQDLGLRPQICLFFYFNFSGCFFVIFYAKMNRCIPVIGDKKKTPFKSCRSDCEHSVKRLRLKPKITTTNR